MNAFSAATSRGISPQCCGFVSLDALNSMWTQYVAAIGEMTLEQARRQWNGWRPYLHFTAGHWATGQDLTLLAKLLTMLDDHYRITEHLVEALDRITDAAVVVAGQISDAAVTALSPGEHLDQSGSGVLDLAEEAVTESLRDAGQAAKKAVLREISELIWVVPRVGR